MKRLLFFIVLAVFSILEIYAQDNSKQLVITEVNLDLKNQEVWIEVFNPTESELVLNSFRISGVRTLNILPPEIRKQKGIKLKPGEYLIICSDNKTFADKYGKSIKVVEVKLLKDINEGGFMIINNLDFVENSKKIIRFGNKDKSAALADKVSDEDVVIFSEDGMSYSREVKDSGEISAWSKTIPTPGKQGR